MSIEVIHEKQATVLIPRQPRMLARDVEAFRSALKDARDTPPGHLILDLESVSQLDSTILGVLVGIYQTFQPGRRLIICGAGGAVQSLLKLTQLHRFFKIVASRDDAIQALKEHREQD